MRLIDADELKLSHCLECTLYPDKCLKDNCDWGSIYHIKIAKTIEAIPIEWLRENQKWLLEHLEVYEDKIEELIECWEEDK